MSVDDARATTPAGRLRATAAAAGDRVALRWQDRQVTYAELDARVDAAAAGLAGLGVRAGDRVAIVLSNTPTFVEAWFATQRLGAVAVPTAPALAPDELRHVLGDSGATVAVVASRIADVLDGLHERLPSLRVVVTEGPVPVPTADATPQQPARHGWDAVVAGEAGTGDVPADDAAGPDDLAALVYTSGTTGRPRGAMLTCGNLVANQDQSLAGRLRLRPDDVVLAVLPLSHVYGLNVVLGPAVTVGCTVVLQERFDAAGTAQIVADHRVTVVPGAPPMWVAWAQQPPAGQFGTVRLCGSGAAPLPRAAAASFTAATGLAIDDAYGLTEASPAVCAAAADDDPRPGSVGVPLPGVELRIVDDGVDAEPGEPGEVWVRGPNVFVGYWNDEEATARALTPDGWLRTGDLGVLDDGRLRLVDRRTDLILVRGFNVYPAEVERVLREHPGVAAAAVVGAPHPVTGETPVAHVVRADDAPLVEEDLDAHCRARLARYKCPTSYRVVETLPVTRTGKLRRADLRI